MKSRTKIFFFFLQNRFFTAFAKSERDFISSKCFFLYWYMKTWKVIKTLLMSLYFSRFDFRSAQTLAASDVIGSVLLSNIWDQIRNKDCLRKSNKHNLTLLWIGNLGVVSSWKCSAFLWLCFHSYNGMIKFWGNYAKT